MIHRFSNFLLVLAELHKQLIFYSFLLTLLNNNLLNFVFFLFSYILSKCILFAISQHLNTIKTPYFYQKECILNYGGRKTWQDADALQLQQLVEDEDQLHDALLQQDDDADDKSRCHSRSMIMLLTFSFFTILSVEENFFHHSFR